MKKQAKKSGGGNGNGKGLAASDVQRAVLPIPDRQTVGITTYDAKDPNTKLSADHAAASAAGRAQRADLPDRRRRLRRLERVRGAVPHADRGAARGGRLEVHALPHDGAVRADARRDALRPQPPLGRHGRHHRDGDVGARQLQPAAQEQGAAGRDPEAERLLHRLSRQVPRGADLGDQPDRPVRPLADRLGLRILLRFRRRRGEPVLPGPVRGDVGGRAAQDARGGLHAERRPRRQGGALAAPAEGARARQAVFHVLRARRDTRAAPRAQGVVGEIQGQVRRRLGQTARGDVRPAEEAGRDSEGCRADGAAEADPRLGRHAGRPQADPGAADGDLRRLPRADRSPHRPRRRRARGAERPRRHADLSDHRRQRRVGGGHRSTAASTR